MTNMSAHEPVCVCMCMCVYVCEGPRSRFSCMPRRRFLWFVALPVCAGDHTHTATHVCQLAVEEQRIERELREYAALPEFLRRQIPPPTRRAPFPLDLTITSV